MTAQPQEQWGIQRGTGSVLIWKIEKPLEVYTFPLSALDYIESHARAEDTELFEQLKTILKPKPTVMGELRAMDKAQKLVLRRLQSGGKVRG